MNGIDISGHQPNINLAAVPCDFVIIKATQGKSFVNPEFAAQITQALYLGKYVGVYHYANGAGVDIEADHFIDVIKPYLGKVILAIDWENNKDKKGNNDNPKFVAGDYKYCERLLTTVKDKTGVTPFLYMSKSVARQFKWEVGRNFPFWCAQYKLIPPTTYVTKPWTDSKGWGPWPGCKILQYSSKGKLLGYKGTFDLNMAYMDGYEWLRWADGDLLPEEPQEVLQPYLKMGDRNDFVRAWQIYLKSLGYDIGKAGADGIFGQDTFDAVYKYQKDHPECGKPDGIIGPKTWASIANNNV